ncbi:MAG: hypothetical protein J4431_04565 [Candidatus Aenigmarchaeota archaeon]|nr:hypothetical protein [Candidatus Aenigmarchaeota archaeon]
MTEVSDNSVFAVYRECLKTNVIYYNFCSYLYVRLHEFMRIGDVKNLQRLNLFAVNQIMEAGKPFGTPSILRYKGMKFYINFGWDGDSILGPYDTMQDVHGAALSFPKGSEYDVILRSLDGPEDVRIRYTRGQEMLGIEESARIVPQPRRVVPSVYSHEN